MFVLQQIVTGELVLSEYNACDWSLSLATLARGRTLHSKNKLVKVTTNVCHNTHYFCVVMFTTNFVVIVTAM